MKSGSSLGIKTYVYIAWMAVLICVCSWLAIPFPVPFTMQTFAVFCSLVLLGGKRGTAAIGLYIVMGLIGLPVFSGFRGGVGHLIGPTGGYIIGFLFSGIVYILLEPLLGKRRRVRWVILGTGLAVCYAVGTLWFMMISSTQGTGYSFFSALSLCVLPYVVPDCAKIALALFVCDRISSARRGKPFQ